jgi:uncharacterized SAM-binding protein YcdF (DUF218 family)
LLLIGLACFAVPPPAENDPAATDAIVVLTGASLRLQSGIDLMREGKGRTLFISGVNQRVGIADLLHAAGEEMPQWLVCCVVLGHEAKNTMGNAAETAQWMRQQGYHSLRLVTSWYHMPRSLLDFRRAMPDLEIIPHPVFSDEAKPPAWWSRHSTAVLLVSEYAKYLATLFIPFVDQPSFSDAHRIGVEGIEARR